MDGKTKAIVTHITFIGLIIALISNSKKKDEFASFYIRQTLGLYLAGAITSVLSPIPLIGFLAGIVGLVIFILWLISLINAISDKKAPLPLVGDFFQELFKSL